MSLEIGDKHAGYQIDDICICRHDFTSHDNQDMNRNCTKCGCPLFRPVRLQPDAMSHLCFACAHTRGMHSPVRIDKNKNYYWSYEDPKLRHLLLIYVCSCGCEDFLYEPKNIVEN